MKKYIIIALALMMNIFAVAIGNAAVTAEVVGASKKQVKNRKMNAKVETRRVPKGTRLKLRMLDYVGTESSQEGTMFSATLVNDERVDKSMILPAGTLVRGYVQKIKPAKILSKGAVLYLKFDHIVLPSGSQLPVKAVLTGRLRMTYDEGVYFQSGYGDALKENWSKTKEIAVNTTHWGSEKDKPANYFLTPVGAIGGFFGGAGYLVGDSVVDLFRKGKPVYFGKDDIVEVVIMQDLDVPVL